MTCPGGQWQPGTFVASQVMFGLSHVGGQPEPSERKNCPSIGQVEPRMKQALLNNLLRFIQSGLIQQ